MRETDRFADEFAVLLHLASLYMYLYICMILCICTSIFTCTCIPDKHARSEIDLCHQGANEEEMRLAQAFFRVLSLCHAIVPDRDPKTEKVSSHFLCIFAVPEAFFFVGVAPVFD
jgi:hypothetical protein